MLLIWPRTGPRSLGTMLSGSSIHQEDSLFWLKPKGTQMSSAIWNVTAAPSLVAHSPVAGFQGARPRRCGLKENQYFPLLPESNGICFQL